MSEPAAPPAAPAAPTQGTPAPPEQKTFPVEYVRELREENAAQRVARNAAETKAQAAEESKAIAITEAEKKVADATKLADDRIIRAELKASALKAGMIDLDGLKMADLSKVKLDANGEIEGADALMVDLKKAKPFLFGSGTTTSSTTAPPKPGDGKPRQATDLSDDEYKKARADIRAGRLPVAVGI